MPAASELIGHGRSVEEIREAIGADKLIYQDIEDLHLACRGVDTDIDSFEDSVFTGRYLSARVKPETTSTTSRAARNDATKKACAAPKNEILAKGMNHNVRTAIPAKSQVEHLSRQRALSTALIDSSICLAARTDSSATPRFSAG